MCLSTSTHLSVLLLQNVVPETLRPSASSDVKEEELHLAAQFGHAPVSFVQFVVVILYIVADRVPSIEQPSVV